MQRKRTGMKSGKQETKGRQKKQEHGHWGRDEHQRLLKALERHGNQWKKVEKAVGTRDRDQIRSHAQKYFQKQRRHVIRHLEAEGTLKGQIFAVVREYRSYGGDALQQSLHERVDWDNLRPTPPVLSCNTFSCSKSIDSLDQEGLDNSRAEASQYDNVLGEDPDLIPSNRRAAHIPIQTLRPDPPGSEPLYNPTIMNSLLL